MNNLDTNEAKDLISNVKHSSKEFAISITTLYVKNAHKCLNVPTFKDLCSKHLPSLNYKSLFEHAKAGEISESLGLEVSRYSNSAMLELRRLNVTQRRDVWDKVCEATENDSPNTKAVTRDLVREIISKNKELSKLTKKVKKPKLDTKTFVEAIESEDCNRIASVFYSMITDLNEVGLVIENLNKFYNTEHGTGDEENLSFEEELL